MTNKEPWSSNSLIEKHSINLERKQVQFTHNKACFVDPYDWLAFVDDPFDSFSHCTYHTIPSHACAIVIFFLFAHVPGHTTKIFLWRIQSIWLVAPFVICLRFCWIWMGTAARHESFNQIQHSDAQPPLLWFLVNDEHPFRPSAPLTYNNNIEYNQVFAFQSSLC